MQNFLTFFKNKINESVLWGVLDQNPLSRHIHMTNILTLIFAAVGIPFILIDVLNGWYMSAVMNVFAVALFLSVLGMNRRGYYRQSRLLFVFIINLATFVFSADGPHGLGNRSFFFAIVGLPLLLFGLKERWELAFGFLLSLVSYLLLDRYNFNFLNSMIKPQTMFSHQLALVEVFIMLFASTYFFSRNAERAENNLKFLYHDLERSQTANIYSSKMAALGEMASGVAHEINNPLAVIHLRAQLLKAQLESKTIDFSQAEQSLDSIEGTVTRINRIVKGLLAFARKSDGTPFKPVPLRQIIENTLDLCHEKLKNEGIDLRIQEISIGLEIECRSVEISQILLNLINNACDATADQAERWIAIQVNDQGKDIKISVTDSNKGIPTEIREKMFQPFFTTKEVGKGTGLGLSLSKGIAESHQGFLRLDEDSVNTRFVFTIPKIQKPSGESATPL